MPMKSTIDLHLTPTNANIGVREIKLLGRILVFLLPKWRPGTLYVVKRNLLDFNKNSSTNKLFTSVLSRQEHIASQLINARFSYNCYLTIAIPIKESLAISSIIIRTQLNSSKVRDLYDNNLGRLSEHGHIRILIKDKKFNTEQNQWSWVAGKNREFTQRRRRRLRKRHLKSEFALPQTLSRLFHLVKFVRCSQIFLECCWILNDRIKVKEKKRKVVFFCSRPRPKVNLGSFPL